MAFLGRVPGQLALRPVLKQTITPDGSASFTLDNQVSQNALDVFVNNVRQEPGIAYTVSGTTITFTEAPAVGSSVYIVYQKSVLGAEVLPGPDTLTTAMIQDGAITPAKLATSVDTHDSAAVQAQFDSAFPSAFDTRFALQDTHDSAAVQAQFDSALAGDVTLGNMTTTGYLRGPATFTIDPAVHGDSTGLVTILGNLQVEGATTTINSTALTVNDKNIVLADSAANAAAADGAGITVAGASATLTYNSSPDGWSFNKRVGIGYNDPSYQLVVSNSGAEGLEIDPVNQDQTVRIFAYDRTASDYIAMGNFANNHYWTAGGSTTKMVLDSDGTLKLLGSNGSETNSLSFSYNATSGVATVGPNSNGGSTFINLGTSNSGTYDTRVRINNDGKVGIGTTSPTTPLDIEGAWVPNHGILAINATSGQYSGLTTQKGGVSYGYLYYDSDNSALNVYGAASTALRLWTNNSERAMIDASGTLGIATTPNTMHASYDGIQVKNSLWFTNSSNFSGFTQNAYYDGNYKYATTGEATLFRQISGHFEFLSAVSDTADAQMYFSNRMRIANTGQVSIGTDTPTTLAEADNLTILDTGHCGITIHSGTSSEGGIFFADGTSGADRYRGIIRYNQGSDYLQMYTAATERMRIHNDGEVELKTPRFMINHSNAGIYKNLGTVMGNSSSGRYIHVKTNAVWGENSMTMFRITGYFPYSAYGEGYLGGYLYSSSSYRSAPYGPIYANQGNHAVAHSMYYSQGTGAELILVLDWNTPYNGLMIEHIGAGSSYGDLMRDDLEITAYTHSANTTGVY